MVLEHLIPATLLEKKMGAAIILGAGFSIVGTILAFFIFGANAGLASVIFITILLIPSIRKLLKREEKVEEKERKFTLKELWKDNKHLLMAYGGIFIGVFFTYYLGTSIGYSLGLPIEKIFREQVFLEMASGRASFVSPLFWQILFNNWWVLAIAFILSLISGDGASFFIVWNASAWGAIFGLRTIGAAAVLGEPALFIGPVMLLIIAPHMIIEMISYILAGIAGSIISDEVITKSKEMKNFVLQAGIIFGIFFAVTYMIKRMSEGVLANIAIILLFVGLLYMLKDGFKLKKHIRVFMYNYYLFIIALLVFILGAIIETLVLSNSGLLATYYSASFNYFNF